MSAIDRPIVNLHWQDNPPCSGLYLYRDKETPYIVLAVIEYERSNGVDVYSITPFGPNINPPYNMTWYHLAIHFLDDLQERQCRFWGPINLEWIYQNFDCKTVDYRKPLKWTQPKGYQRSKKTPC